MYVFTIKGQNPSGNGHFLKGCAIELRQICPFWCNTSYTCAIQIGYNRLCTESLRMCLSLFVPKEKKNSETQFYLLLCNEKRAQKIPDKLLFFAFLCYA